MENKIFQRGKNSKNDSEIKIDQKTENSTDEKRSMSARIRRPTIVNSQRSPQKNFSTASVALKINKNTEEFLEGRRKDSNTLRFGLKNMSMSDKSLFSNNGVSSPFLKRLTKVEKYNPKIPIPGIVHTLHCSNPNHPEYNLKFQNLQVGIGRRLDIFKELEFASTKVK